jgi:predicted Zn finger-like uncharacterized protein
MYSQCPDCQTRFRVTAEALRVAHGTVRCGRCGSAFDALARLSDTIPPPGPTVDATIAVRMPAAAAPLQSGERAAAADFHFSAADLERVFVDARDWQRQYGPTGAAPASGIPTNEPSELVVDESESLEDITLEGERIQIDVPPGFEDDADVVEALEHEANDDLDATDRFRTLDPASLEHDFIDEIEVEDHTGEQEAAEILKLADAIRAEEEFTAAAAAHPAIEPPRPAFVPTSQPAPVVPERPTRSVETIAPRRWQAPVREAESDVLPTGRRVSGEADEDQAPRRRGLAWTLGSLVLALALLAQLTHYFRQDLVRHPQIGPLLGQVYDRLGLDLAPNWDPRAFEIRQWGNSGTTPAANRMTVQASIRNKAAFAQPYPLLRLELEDRFGAPVATRDFEPSEYLKVPSLATRLLAAGASADADLEIVDPGADAVGYRLDVCLRESAEILRCAQGPG